MVYAFTEKSNKKNSNYFYIIGNFWERLELESFPIDVQELSIIVASRLSSDEIHLEADPTKWSHMRSNTTNVFTEQQKWFVFFFTISTEFQETISI
jgi:hypothetical protein